MAYLRVTLSALDLSFSLPLSQVFASALHATCAALFVAVTPAAASVFPPPAAEIHNVT